MSWQTSQQIWSKVYPLNVGQWLNWGTNKNDPVILDIDTLTPWSATLNSLVAFSEWGVENSMTLTQLASIIASSILWRTIRTETANFTVLLSDQSNIVHIDNSATTIDIQLPDPTTVEVWSSFYFKTVNATNNKVMFLSFGSELIDWAVNYVWNNPAWWEALEVYTDWVNWFIS